MKIEEICRTCLSESSDLRSIFKLGVIAGKTTTLSRVLMEFTKLTINDFDNFPYKMCYGCVIQANQAFAFLQTCLESDRYLRENLGKDKFTLRKMQCNDENMMTEAETQTQTVYLYNAIDIEGDHEISVHIEPSEIKVIKNESATTLDSSSEPSTNHGTIILTTEPSDSNEQNQNETETLIPDIIEDDNLETEILEEIENEEIENGNSNSSFDNINAEEYYEENNTSNTMKNDDSNVLLDMNFDENEENDVNMQIVKLENDDVSNGFKKIRNTRIYTDKLNIPGPPYICSMCQKHLSTKSSYKYHMQLHSDATPFLCNECGEGFKTRNAYEGHMTTHDINNPHKCEICGKIYRQANSLKTHMINHTGEKPFLCGICGKGMTQKSGFKKHMLVHSGEMPFECQICRKKFRYSSNLIAHKKTHFEKKENLNLCKVCSKPCSSPIELKKHMNIHVAAKPQACPLCGKHITKIETLRAHLKLLHKQDFSEENETNLNNTILPD